MSPHASRSEDTAAIKRDARFAGWMYLLMALPAPFALLYVPLRLIVRGDASRTASNILGHEMMFRTAILAGLASAVGFILLGIALWRLLGEVDRTLAALMVICIAISVAIEFVNEAYNLTALALFRGADFLKALDTPQREALGMILIRLHQHGNVVNEVFWGLWLLPFGLLVMRSGFLPRILGLLLIVNGLAYVLASATALLWPSYYNAVFLAATPALLGELWILLWLLIKGAKEQPTALAA